MSKPVIEIPEDVKEVVEVVIRNGFDLYLPSTIKLAEFIDQFIEKPIVAEPFVVYEVKVEDYENIRFLGFKSNIAAIEWTVAPYEFDEEEPIYLRDQQEPRFVRDDQVTVIRRITPDNALEFGLGGKSFKENDEVLVKASLAQREIPDDGFIRVELEDSLVTYADARHIALVKED